MAWRYKAAKEKVRWSLCRSLEPTSGAGYGSWGNTEKSFFIWIHECDQTQLWCDPIMPMRILKTILQALIMCKRITHSLFFPKELFFPLCQLGSYWKVNPQPALITFVFNIVIFVIAIRMIIRVTHIGLRVTACSFFRGCKSRKRAWDKAFKFCALM